MVSRLRPALTALALLCVLAFPARAYERIVSLYPGHTDNIVALGGQNRLAGLSQSDDPALLPGLPRFAVKTGAEAILAAKPDLVLLRTFNERQNPSLRGVLERAGVAVICLDPPRWDGFTAYLRTLAPLIDVDPESAARQFEEICGHIRSEASAARRSGAPSPSVFVEATAKELHTCAPNSWAARVIELAGGVNAAGSARPVREGGSIAPWGLERVMALLDSGLNVYLIQQGPMNRTTREEFAARPWSGSLGRTRVATIPENILSRPSLLGLKDGAEALLKIFRGE